MLQAFTGKLTRDGAVIVESVSGSIHHAHDLPEWNGVMDVGTSEAATELLIGGPFELQLSDGRSGRAIASGHNAGTTEVNFTGTGPMK